MNKVVIGLLGPKLDSGTGPQRWDRWRPTVSLFGHEELLIDRLELLVESKFKALANQVVEDVKQISPETEVNLHEVSFGQDAWDLEVVYGALHDWARSYSFNVEKEDYLIHITTGTHVAQISMFLLNEAGFLPGQLLQASPPRASRTRVEKSRYATIDLDLSKYDKLSSRFAEEAIESTDFLKSGIETKSEKFNQLIERIEKVSMCSQEPMLITGPTGAGKSHLVGRIFELRKQRKGLRGNFVEVNCATLTGDTASSTLFGHVRGAFTGAQKDRAGLLKEADGGLLFLDEIGELGLDEQAKLLRALEEKTFLPVGADKSVKSDFQLIAGTNRDLREEVAVGRFREDLLARIQLWTFALPSLAERREDIEPNIIYELNRFSQREGRKITFNKEASELFLKFAKSPETKWSGNFRDLNSAIIRMSTLAPRGRIRTEEVEEERERLKQSWNRPSSMPNGSREAVNLTNFLSKEQIDEIDCFDQHQLAYVIAVCKRSKSLADAGRELYNVSREKRAVANDSDRVKKYLKKFGLEFGSMKFGIIKEQRV